MKLKIVKNYLTKNRCYQRNVKRKPIGIQLHTIGTGQGTAQAVADYWNQSAVSACVTYIVDCDTEGKVLQCLPEDVRSWADAGYGNDHLITFEICESDYIRYTGGANYDVLDAKRFKADIMRGYNTAVLLCADICRRHEWNPTAKLPSGLYLISSHDEGRRAGLSSDHVDPTHVWGRFGLTMNGFRADVKAALDGNFEVTDSEPEKWYRVRKTWEDAGTQLGAYLSLENAKANCPAGYTVYDWNGKAVYTNTVKGFQAMSMKGLTEAERIGKIAPFYVESAKTTGMLPSVGIAQFILESGYGSTDLAEHANNLHGMKCSLSGNTWKGSTWDGKSKYGKYSPEVENGVTVQRYSEFRKYPCCEDSIADRAAYFTNAMDGASKRYPGLVGEKDHKKAIKIIKAGRYATDPEYVDKLCEIVNRWKLTEYDAGFVGNDTEENGGADILPDTPDQQWYRVRKSWADAKSQIGAYHDLTKAKKCADDHPGYRVYDESGTQIYPPAAQISGDIIAACKVFQKQLKADIAAGKSWEYRNPSKYLEEQWSKALKKEKRACNCALLARWALKEAGLIPQDTGIFYGKLGGTISWGAGTKAAVTKTCDLLKIGNKTVKQLIASGDLQPGDIVTYVDLQHTNIYAGNGKWYDAGHAYCKGSGEGAVFKSWYGDGQYDNQRVGYIIRRRAGSNEYIVQAGVFAEKKNAEKLFRQLKKKGFDAIIKKRSGQWVVQCGVFSVRKNAEALAKQLKKAGFSAIIK